MPEIICKMHFSTVSALTYQVFLKKFICRRFLFAFYRNFHSNFSHLNFSTWILICQAALNFNCRHFFHISNWILEITFSSEIYWRLLSNLNIKTSKFFFGTCLVKDWDWTGRFLRAISKFNFCFLLMSWRIQNARPISNIYIYTYICLKCVAGQSHATFWDEYLKPLKKTIFQFQSLEWKVWDTGFKSLKNLMSTSNPWMENLRMKKSKYCRKNLNIESLSEKNRDKNSQNPEVRLCEIFNP